MTQLSTAHTPRIVFANGAINQLAEEIHLLHKTRILLICDESSSSHASRVKEELGSLIKQSVTSVVMHVPDEFSLPITSQARSLDIDLVVTIGGGSATGLGKIVALDCGIDLLAIPTTYAGSEMTTIWGRTHESKKITGRSLEVLPKTTIYDPELTYSLPLSISANSGMNAIAHSVEALYAPDVTPEVKAAAIEGIEIFAVGLRGITKDIHNPAARELLMRGSMLCGFALSNSTMGIHHKICHTLGGMFDLPHAQMHSAVLPWAARYNRDFAREQLDEVAKVLQARSAASGLWALAKDIGAETSLSNIGYPIEESEKVADVIEAATFANPRPFSRTAVVDLLRKAYEGSRPDDGF